jgi:hypothetical protein
MVGHGHGAGDELVGSFKQNHQVMALRGLGLTFGAEAGHSGPTQLHDPADAVLVMLSKAMP